MGLNAVQTPNATTIVFHLAKPFADFNYVVAIPQTAPVPPNKDTGTNYQLHPISTGPYKFQSYQLNKQLTMVPNTFWKASTDPNAKQLPSKIVINLNVNANDLDNRLLAGDLDVDAAGHRRAGGGAGQDLVLADAEGLVRQPDQRVPVVRLPQHQGGAAEQRGLPSGDRVRGEQDQPADRLRRPGRRRRDRQHGGPAERHRPEALRPVRGHHQARRGHHRRPRRR